MSGARNAANATRARFQADQDANLRLPSSEKVAALEKLNKFFDDEFTSPLAKNEIPYKLLDSKEALKALRTHISDAIGISFRDRDIIDSFQSDEIAPEIKSILEKVLSLFVETSVRSRKRPSQSVAS